MDRKCKNCGKGRGDDELACEKCGVRNEKFKNEKISQQISSKPERIPNFKTQSFDVNNSDLKSQFIPYNSYLTCNYASHSHESHFKTSIRLNGINLNKKVIEYDHFP
jgi:hypothetical protein